MAKRMNKTQREIFDATLSSYGEVDSVQIVADIRSKSAERDHLWADAQKLDAEIAALKDLLEDRGDFDLLDEECNFDQDLPTVESLY